MAEIVCVLPQFKAPVCHQEVQSFLKKEGKGSQSNKESLFDSEKRQITTYWLNFVMVKLFIRSTSLKGAEGVAREM